MALKCVCGALLFLIMGCTESTPSASPGTKTDQEPSGIVVTDPQLSCLVERLVGDEIEITVIAPPDPEAHSHAWTPTREESRTLRKAALVITGGAGTDGWLDTLGVRRDRVVRASAGLDDALIVLENVSHSHGPSGAHSHPVYAPRPWTDPALTPLVMRTIGTALDASFPAHRDTLPERLLEQQRRREDLRARFDDVHDDTLLVTTSEAWRYAARRLGSPVLVVDTGDDPAWIRIEATSRNAQRVLLIGAFNESEMRALFVDAPLEIVVLREAETDPCGWESVLEAAAEAITDG